jgi:predicted TIM-barrel fold metal-dependent hydrolase
VRSTPPRWVKCFILHACNLPSSMIVLARLQDGLSTVSSKMPRRSFPRSASTNFRKLVLTVPLVRHPTSMSTATMGRFVKRMFHSFYAILSSVKIRTRASFLFPIKPTKSITFASSRQCTQPAPKRTLAQRLPVDTWDGHMHFIDPKRYSLAKGAAYVPSIHSVWDAVTFEDTVGMKNVVAVQPSIYGNDNSAMLDAMKALGPERSRGVVVLDESTIQSETLHEWHALGVRGVRLNLSSTGQTPDIEVLKNTLRRYADIVQPLGWMVQIYVSMDLLPALESIIKSLDVKICFDHFANPSKPSNPSPRSPSTPFDPYSITGFSSLIRMLQYGNTFVKFSAPYRMDLENDQLEAVALEILRVQNDRVVFATDWPHTRFEGLDIKAFQEDCLGWAEDAGCVEKVFSLNAKTLWDVE